MAKISTIRWLALGAALALGAPAVHAQQAPIKIGELNSYAQWAAFTVPYRNGWQMALDEINAKGGVLGRKLEIVSRDDGATTGSATRVADELVSREGVSLLFGSFLSNVGVAMADFANQKKIVYIAAEPLTDAVTMAQGNRYTFRVRPNNFMQVGMLVDQAKASGAKRWAIVAPNYEYGQSAAAVFKRLIQERVPGAQIVAEQYPALGKIEAGATASAIEQAKPDGIFNVLFGPDLTQFVREGNTRGLFEGATVLSLLTGEPEWLLPLKDEVPEGWTVTGYPWEAIDTPAHKAFVTAYQKRWNDYPRLGSVVGYDTINSLAAGITKAGSTDTDKLIAAFRGLKVQGPFGPFEYRASDHQATIGAYVGQIALKDGKGTMSDFKYVDGASVLPGDDEVKKMRPAAAMN